MNTIPRNEEAALRLAFEAAMRDTFGVSNLKRTTDDGYVVPEVQMAWFTCRCGWRTGSSARGVAMGAPRYEGRCLGDAEPAWAPLSKADYDHRRSDEQWDVREVPTGVAAGAPARPELCSATDAKHHDGPYGPKRQIVCWYCKEAPTAGVAGAPGPAYGKTYGTENHMQLPPGYEVVAEDVQPSDEPGAWTCKACGFRGFWRGSTHCAVGVSGLGDQTFPAQTPMGGK